MDHNHQPLLPPKQQQEVEEEVALVNRVWIESKKLWRINGPAILSLVSAYTVNIIIQAAGGHLGEVQLAAIAIANAVILGFNYSFLYGMSSALDTLCGQAYGAGRLHMLGIYMQRAWVVQFMWAFLLLPTYVLATPILKLLGQPDEVAELAGEVAMWMVPSHFSFGLLFPLQTFLQSQLKNKVIAFSYPIGLLFNGLSIWLFVYVLGFGVKGAVIAFNVSWWVAILSMFFYCTMGGCPDTWGGYSMEAFHGLWEFTKLSAASGVMICLESWYYRILILMTGYLKNATLAVDALSVCMSINGWEMMIPFAFLTSTAVRVANELGAGNGKAAKFATIVSVTQSLIIGLFFSILIVIFHDKVALLFTPSPAVVHEVDRLSYLLALSVLLNSVQPILSGVAIGSGWQATVAYINLGCYYIVGLPVGILMGWVFNYGVTGVWGGMIIGGTAVQTVILAIIVISCNWEKEAKIAYQRVEKWSTPQN